MRRGQQSSMPASSWLGVLVSVLFLSQVCLASQQESPRITQRTTWPTETGTMVRILKKSSEQPTRPDAYEELPQEELYQLLELRDALLNSLEDLGPKVDNFSRVRKNIFLRTSRSSEEVRKRARGAGSKRDRTKTSNPFLFRTSKRSGTSGDITREERQWLTKMLYENA